MTTLTDEKKKSFRRREDTRGVYFLFEEVSVPRPGGRNPKLIDALYRQSLIIKTD